jgi:hypothetical protein
MAEFGTEISVAGYTFRGDLTIEEARRLAKALVECIGMTPSHPLHVFEYLAVDGKPSPGFIVVQCIIESLIAIDVWPQLHAFYVHAVSCKEFSEEAVTVFMRNRGFEQRSVFGGYLST